jgi:hypothetical protein
MENMKILIIGDLILMGTSNKHDGYKGRKLTDKSIDLIVRFEFYEGYP